MCGCISCFVWIVYILLFFFIENRKQHNLACTRITLCSATFFTVYLKDFTFNIILKIKLGKIKQMLEGKPQIYLIQKQDLKEVKTGSRRYLIGCLLVLAISIGVSIIGARFFIMDIMQSQLQESLERQSQMQAHLPFLNNEITTKLGQIYQKANGRQLMHLDHLKEVQNSQVYSTIPKHLAKNTYSKQEERKKWLQNLQKLPAVTITNQNNGSIDFKVGDKQYSANIQTRRPVTSVSDTIVPQFQYLRPCETTVYSYIPETTPLPSATLSKLLQYQKLTTLKQRQYYISWKSHNGLRYNYYLFKEIVKNPDKKENIQAEYFIYNKTYNLDQPLQQKMMCVVSAGYNLVMSEKYTYYFSSLARQNYTNFKVFHIDDNSEDDTTLRLFAEVAKKYPHLKDKVHFLKNHQNIGAFGNKDSGIKENCPQGSIVIDLDADDGLIGRQTMKVLNAIYQKKTKDNEVPWVVYSNFITKDTKGNYQPGFSKALPVSTSNYRRYTKIGFSTSHLKTYLRDLQVKIPIQYLTIIDEQDPSIRKYPKYASDATMMFSLLELAGDKRSKFASHYFYEYRRNQQFYDQCHRLNQEWNAIMMRVLEPLAPLKNIQDTPQKITGRAYPSVNAVKKENQYKQKCLNN